MWLAEPSHDDFRQYWVEKACTLRQYATVCLCFLFGRYVVVEILIESDAFLFSELLALGVQFLVSHFLGTDEGLFTACPDVLAGNDGTPLLLALNSVALACVED